MPKPPKPLKNLQERVLPPISMKHLDQIPKPELVTRHLDHAKWEVNFLERLLELSLRAEKQRQNLKKTEAI